MPPPPALSWRELRLASGLVLALFLLTHFLNHALGLVSVAAMEEARGWFNRIWRNPVGGFLLYGSLLLHFALALMALHRRRTLRMPLKEAAQLSLGLALPFLLVPHVTGTRLEWSLTGRDVGYPDVVQILWVAAPEIGARQVIALLAAWTHGCLGLFFWLRPRPWFRRWALPLYSAALLVPVLAILGFAQAGKAVAAGVVPVPPSPVAPTPPEVMEAIRLALYAAFAGAILAVLALRAWRIRRGWAQRVRVAYPDGRAVAIPRGFSVLEASRIGGVPHVSICGGRGRCSTCRVRILEGAEDQPAPGAAEAATLERIRASPGVRLACQLRPARDLTVSPVLASARPRISALDPASRAEASREREVAVLFCDLRGFTRLAERRLPFDTVFLLNRYFEVVGRAVAEAGGHLDKFIGDGALALFGLHGGPEEAASQALDAAAAIAAGLADLNRAYASELDRPLRIAMGIHAGPAIVGEMGWGSAVALTAVGDTINAASRLEGVAKELDVELVVSAETVARARLALDGRALRDVPVRGRRAPIAAFAVADAAALRAGAPTA